MRQEQRDMHATVCQSDKMEGTLVTMNVECERSV